MLKFYWYNLINQILNFFLNIINLNFINFRIIKILYVKKEKKRKGWIYFCFSKHGNLGLGVPSLGVL